MSQRYEVELRGGYMGAAPVNDEEFVPQLWAVMDTATDLPVVAFAPREHAEECCDAINQHVDQGGGPYIALRVPKIGPDETPLHELHWRVVDLRTADRLPGEYTNRAEAEDAAADLAHVRGLA